jgi:hypothetical protein
MIISIARSSGIVGIPAVADCLLSRTAQSADLGSKTQRGSQFSGVWDLCRLSRSGFNHRKGGWFLKKKKKMSITVRDGALMDLTILRNAGFSGCAAWKKLRLDILSH